MANADHNETVTFSFGANWLQYLQGVGEAEMLAARAALERLLGRTDLHGEDFIDIGAGSGIVSLSALTLGARRVVSVDRDPNSIACCEQLARRVNDPRWEMRTGSILDAAFIAALGDYDIVYSWGVLHHTGAMWRAIENAARLTRPNGQFVIAIYNRTSTSRFWLWFKRFYNRRGRAGQWFMALLLFIPRVLVRIIRLRHPLKEQRGMSVWHDAVDWAGGLPYEYASFEEIVDFVTPLGFSLERDTRTTRIGCNEFVFRRKPAPAATT